MVAVEIPPSGKQYFYFGTLCPEVEKAGERYQPLPGGVRALPARRAVSRDQIAAPTKRHSSAARPQVLRDKLRRRCWLELPLGSDCWSIAAGAKPAHEQAKGQHEVHTHSGPFSAYRLPCYGCQPPPYATSEELEEKKAKKVGR